METLKLERLSFGYIKAPMQFLDINLSKDLGTVFLFGESGSGKTTLLELLCGLNDLYAGKIWVCGKQPKESTKNITYIPARPVLFKNATVMDNLKYACDAIEELYEKINLKDEWIEKYQNKKVRKLEKIDQLILPLKRAEIKDAKLVLIDLSFDGLSEIEIMDYTKEIEKIMLKKNKLVIISMSAEDFKKTQFNLENVEIWCVFAQKLQKFVNFQDFENNINNVGLAQYLDYKMKNAIIKNSVNGYLLLIEQKTFKLPEKCIAKIEKYFEVEDSAEVILATKTDNEIESQAEFLKELENGQILIFDKLSGELLK